MTDHSTDTNINIMTHAMFVEYCGVHNRKQKLCFKGIKRENGVMLCFKVILLLCNYSNQCPLEYNISTN